MQKAELADPAEESLVDRARKLADGIRERAEQTERDRRVSVETIDEFKEAGLLRGLQASRFGGLERPPAEFFAAVMEIAKACGSTGWVLGVLGVHPFEAAQLTVECQEEIYGDDPNTLTSSSYGDTGQVTRAPGGHRLTGRWYFSSGCEHASWAVLGGSLPSEDGGSVERRIFMLPRRDYRIEDDWYVMGLSGTGSKSIVVDEVFVPEHRSLDWMLVRQARGPGLAVNPGPLFRVPHGAIFNGALIAPAIGAAKGAYEEFGAQLRKRAPRTMPGGPKSVAEDPFVQLRLAETEADIDGVELRIMRDYREMMELAEAGKDIPLESRGRYRWDSVDAVVKCSTAVHRIFEAGGGRVIYQSNPIQRFYRDILAMRQHTMNQWETTARMFAQATLGLPMGELGAAL